MADSIDARENEPVRAPGTLGVGGAEGGVETVVVGEFLRRSGDVLVYRGLYRDAAVHLLEYAPPAFAVRGDEDEVWPIPPRIARKPPGNSTTADPNFNAGRERFAAQTEVLKTLSHPNIVEVIAGFWAGGAIWRVEAVSGPSLAERLADREIEATDDIRWIASNVAAGLEAAHAAGLTHLDVSPEAVVAGPDGEQLSAFGVDRRPYLAETSDRDRLVRPGYAPLELDDPTGEEAIGPATDVHALGALAWRLMTGSAPAHWSERDGPPTPLAGAVAWPEALLEATQAALVVEPEQRLQTAAPFGVVGEARPAKPEPEPEPAPEPTASPETPPEPEPTVQAAPKPKPGPAPTPSPGGRKLPPVLAALGIGLCVIGIVFIVGQLAGAAFRAVSDVLRPGQQPVVAAPFDPTLATTNDVAPDECIWSTKLDDSVALFCKPSRGQATSPSGYDETATGDLRPADGLAASEGDAVSMLRMADFYLGRSGKTTRAIDLMRGAGEKGYVQADYQLAELLSHQTTSAGPQPTRDAREARQLYVRVADSNTALAQTARARVLVLDPEVWSGRWKLEGDEVCKDLVLTDAAVTFWDYYTGPIMTPRTVAGQFQRQLADGLTLMTARLDPTGLNMTLDFTASDGTAPTERYVRCDA